MALDAASQAALNAALGGKDPLTASNEVNERIVDTKGTVDVSELTHTQTSQKELNSPDPLASFMDDEEEQEDSSEESNEEAGSEESQEAGSEESGDVETVYVKDAKGKRKKLQIDYSSKEKTKQAYLKAAGMQKFRQERDDVIGEFKQYKESVAEDLQLSNALQEAYERGGIDGLIELVGGEGASEKYIEQKLSEKRIWEEATPAERQALEAQRRAERESKAKTELEKRLEEMEKKFQSKDVEYEEKQIEGLLHNGYSKYSFDGSLGDEQDEADMNDDLWYRVTRKLEDIPDDEQITKAAVDKAFREEASRLRRRYVKYGKKQASKAVKKQKKKAAESVQHSAKNKMAGQSSDSQARKDFMKKLNSGNMVGAMTDWFSMKK